MDLSASTLSAFQPVFDDMLAEARRDGTERALMPFTLAAAAFGRAPSGPTSPARGVRTMLTVIGQICSTSPEGLAKARDIFAPDAITKAKGDLIGLYFFRLFLKELRAAICDEQKLSRAEAASGFDVKTLVTLIVAQAPSWMGLSNPAVSLIAALVIVIVVQAGHSAFCAATDGEVIDAVSQRSSFEDPDIDN